MTEENRWTRKQLEEAKTRVENQYRNGFLAAVEYEKSIRSLNKLIAQAKD